MSVMMVSEISEHLKLCICSQWESIRVIKLKTLLPASVCHFKTSLSVA